MPAPLALVPLLSGVLLWVGRALVMRFIAAVGLGVVSYRSVSAFFDEMKRYVQEGYRGLSGTVLSLLDIAGLTTAVEIMLSGMAFLAGWYAVSWAFSVFGMKT